MQVKAVASGCHSGW